MISNALIITILTFILFMNVFLSKAYYRELVNPVSIYSLVWLVPTGLSFTNMYGIFTPQYTTVLCVVLNIFAFSFSCMSLRKNSNIISRVSSNEFVKHKLRILVIANFISYIWIFPFVLKMFPFIYLGEWSYARSLYLNVATNNYVYTVIQALILQWFVMPLYYVTALVSAYLTSKYPRKYVGLMILTVFNAIMIVFSTAGRNVILKVLVFYLIFLVLYNKRTKNIVHTIFKSSFSFKILILFSVSFLIYITSFRKVSDATSVLENIYFYIVGPIAYFDKILLNSEKFGLFSDYLFGRATFGFISTPIEIISSILLGFDYHGADNIITSYVSEYMTISTTSNGNAFSTALYPFMMDFGWLGVLLGPIIYGQIVGRIFNLAVISEKDSIFWRCLNVFIMFTVIFSEWEYELMFPYTFFVILFLVIFCYNIRFKIL